MIFKLDPSRYTQNLSIFFCIDLILICSLPLVIPLILLTLPWPSHDYDRWYDSSLRWRQCRNVGQRWCLPQMTFIKGYFRSSVPKMLTHRRIAIKVIAGSPKCRSKVDCVGEYGGSRWKVIGGRPKCRSKLDNVGEYDLTVVVAASAPKWFCRLTASNSSPPLRW